MTPPRTADRVLILGAGGFLGGNVALGAAGNPARQTFVHSRRGVVRVAGSTSVAGDLFTEGVVDRVIQGSQPQLVLNCVAMADVDMCERSPELSLRLNAELPGEIAIACDRIGAQLVHVSTDAVFGAVDGPFHHDSPYSYVNRYGEHKALGEQEVLKHTADAIVARTNIVGWSPSGSRSLFEFFWGKLNDGASMRGFTDIAFRPIAASDFWALVSMLVGAGETNVSPAGPRTSDARTTRIVHLVGHQLLSKYEFGLRVAQCFGFDQELVRPSSVAELDPTAARAHVLDLEPEQTLLDSVPQLLDIDAALHRLRALAADGYRERLGSLLNTEVEP